MHRDDTFVGSRVDWHVWDNEFCMDITVQFPVEVDYVLWADKIIAFINYSLISLIIICFLTEKFT
jgi:hypothetical protein